jgi:hypothetical protein
VRGPGAHAAKPLTLTLSQRERGSEAWPTRSFETALGKLEKDLEIILAKHLLDVLFEDAALMPIFQERAAIPADDLCILCDHERGQRSEGFDRPWPSFAETVSLCGATLCW